MSTIYFYTNDAFNCGGLALAQRHGFHNQQCDVLNNVQSTEDKVESAPLTKHINIYIHTVTF